jgi:hypothetical protein
MKMAGIDKIKETIAKVRELADTVGKVLEDGSIGLGDIVELPSLISEAVSLPGLVAASAEEIKDLDASEAKELLTEAFDLVAYVVSKFLPSGK